MQYSYRVKLPNNDQEYVFADGTRIEEGLLYFFDNGDPGVTYVFNKWIFYEKIGTVEEEESE